MPQATVGLGNKKKPIRILAGATISTKLINRSLISCHSFLLFLSRGAPLLFNPSGPLIPSLVPTSSGVTVRRHIAMSLTSRVFGLFSTPNSDPTGTPAGDSPTSTWTQPTDTTAFYNDLNHSIHDDLAAEEEPRPPYLHVRFQRYHCVDQG
jgi:hypothetical protein